MWANAEPRALRLDRAPGGQMLMSIKEYAAHRGVSEGAVRRAIRERRISLIEGGIHPDAADAEWARNTRPKRATGKAAAARASAIAEGTAAPTSSGDELYRIRLERERTEARIKAIDLAEREGALIEAEPVRRAVETIMTEVRDALSCMGRRAAGRCIGLSSPREVQAVLDEEHRAVLQRMVQRFTQLAAAPDKGD